MNPPEADGPAPLARADNEPVFDEPWQAQALGLAFSLSESGVFSPADWSAALGKAHRELIAQGRPDTTWTYYEAVALALQRLLADVETFSDDIIKERTDAWRRAYLNTPHGAPVELAAGFKKS